MARRYKAGIGTRLVNAVMGLMVRRGRGPSFLHLLSVPGRKTGKIHSTPVDVMEVDGRRYLVAPYGETNWVRNARAAGEVTLARGGRSEILRVTEVDSNEAVPVLREYLRKIRVVRPYFDVGPESSAEDFAVEAKKHPVFRLESVSG